MKLTEALLKEFYDLEEKITNDNSENIEEDIETVDGGLLSEVLSQHYLCGRSLEETAYALNYSKRHIERLHKTAMEKLSIS